MLCSRIFLTLAVVAGLSSAALASPAVTIVTVQTAKWQPMPAPFKGAEMAAVAGNPKTAGAYYAYLIKMPDGMRVPPHFHGMTENVNVISGTILVGLGDTMNVAKMSALAPGTVVSIPAGVHHYAMAKGPTVIEVSGIGPDTLTLIHK